MVIDRISASKNYMKQNYTQRSALEYYERGKAHYVMHEESRFLLEYLLKMMAEKGEQETYSYMRLVLLKHKNRDYHICDGQLFLD